MYEMQWKYNDSEKVFTSRLLTADANYAWRLAKKNIRNMNDFAVMGLKATLINVIPC